MRLGIIAASDAIEIHGGNGNVEQWPVYRLLRNAQVNTIWEGADNILCLDVRRGIEREDAHVPFLERLRAACDAGGANGDDATVGLVRLAIEDTEAAITRDIRPDRRPTRGPPPVQGALGRRVHRRADDVRLSVCGIAPGLAQAKPRVRH